MMFIETIKIINGRAQHIRYHQYRLDKTIFENYGVANERIFLNQLIRVPEEFRSGIVKCRVIFGESLKEINYEPYSLKKIETLKKVHADDIAYAYKYEDRSVIRRLFEQREGCDDILIIKNGEVTDTSYANIAFVKDGIYYTPKRPLLAGTARNRLISQGLLVEKAIEDDIYCYDYATIFNAMVSIDTIKVNVGNIS